MFKKTITYVDYNDVTRTEDFFFNLTKSDIMKMEMSVQGGLAEMIKRIVAAEDAPAIIAVFEDLIQKSYGVKTLDGKGFDKNPKHFEAFKQTPAYDELFMQLATDADAAAEFVNQIIPSDMRKQLAEQSAN